MIRKIRRPLVLIIAILILATGCATTGYDDPVLAQKDVYLQARKHFNDALIQLNTMIKMQPVEEKAELKAEFSPYIDAMVLSLDTWGLVVKQGNLNDVNERRVYQESKAQMLALLTKYLTK
jgi:hypothetical protein